MCTGKLFSRIFILLWMIQCTCAQWYLISDYYMDESHAESFGGLCGETTKDVCLFLNSHINSLKLAKYPADNDCTVTIDAGSMGGARHRVDILYFDLQPTDVMIGRCVDYVAFYDGPTVDDATLVDRFCGEEIPDLEVESFVDDFPTQRYITVRFKTDEVEQRKGFKIMFTRHTPPPCYEEEYHCLYEDRCIDKRLRCDGTEQCVDGQDERNCSAFYQFTGSILRHGSSGLVGIGIGGLCVVMVAVIATVAVIVTCHLKKRRPVLITPEVTSAPGAAAAPGMQNQNPGNCLGQLFARVRQTGASMQTQLAGLFGGRQRSGLTAQTTA